MEQFEFPFTIRCSVTYDDRTVTSFLNVSGKLVDVDVEIEDNSVDPKIVLKEES